MRTPHPREQLGNRLICDSLAISYSRGDIDDTIAEEDEDEDEDDDEGNYDDRVRDGDMSNGHGATADDDTALLEQVVIGRQRRSGHHNSRGGRGKSRSVSPGARATAAIHHDYVNSAPGAARILGEAAGFGGSIPAIPPPPTVGQGDSEDPYGKEFDAIGSRAKSATTTTTGIPSSTGSRINGRVLPPAHQQQPEVRKELASIPPRLRNGFVTGPSPSPSGSGGV